MEVASDHDDEMDSSAVVGSSAGSSASLWHEDGPKNVTRMDVDEDVQLQVLSGLVKSALLLVPLASMWLIHTPSNPN